jgi:hypothetical protein
MNPSLYDEHVPPSLKEMQEWFGDVLMTASPNLELADRMIKPSVSLKPQERVHIYHEQYWLKHSSLLKDAFPMLYKRLNVHFDELITYPYMEGQPSRSWSVYQLGDSLIEWMQGKFEPLFIETAKIDRAFKRAFIAKEYPRLHAIDSEKPFILQPFVHLFHFSHVMLPYSESPDKDDFYLVIFRQHDLKWKEIDQEAYTLLSALKNAKTLDQLFDEVEVKNPSQLSTYFELFIFHNWITCLPEMPPT